MELIIVTGLSGAGRRSVLAALEDADYVALDNVPSQLIGPLMGLENTKGICKGRLALGMDSRHLDFPTHFAPTLEQLQAMGIIPFVLFLECENEVLIRRYSESRRPHRIAGDGPIAEGIAKERGLLQVVRDRASFILDTSHLTLYQLKQRIAEILPKCPEAVTHLNILSFGFKHGLPPEADTVFDARFLPNPYYVPELRPYTGKDEEILSYLGQFKEFSEYLDRLEGWVLWAWPLIREETKAYHTIAIGCTGGQHRSVALAEKLAERLKGRIESMAVRHREIKREG